MLRRNTNPFCPRLWSAAPIAALLVGAAALLPLAGCGSEEADEGSTTTVVTTTPDATTTTTTGGTTVIAEKPPTNNVNAGPGSEAGTDEATTKAVKEAIYANKQMTGSRIEVVVTGGVATLTGIVQNQQQKALAAKAATNTSGVIDVKNKIEIRPTGGAKSPKPKAPAPATRTEVIVVPAPAAPPAEPAPTEPVTPAEGTDPKEPGETTTPESGGTTSPPSGATRP